MSVEGQGQNREADRNSWNSQSKALSPSPRDTGLGEFVGPRAYGRLALLKPLARGGMGEVYLAALGDIEGAERPCVVKLIRHEHRDDASFVARFLDEARIQAQMQHPGVAQVLEAALDPEGRPYVVVEYVAGRDLAEIRQRASQLKLQITWSDAVAIAASLAEALAHVHERTDPDGRPLEVVHRDLSPQNIMVSYVGDTKLIDFGTARGENRRCQTINGIVFAKPGYVAPEVAANIPGGAAADLYALGIVVWELIAGRRFLQGDTQEHLAAVAKGERTPPALSLWLAVPRELDTVIGRMTAPRIEDRFPSAREAHEQLVKLLQQAPGLANGERSVRSRIAHLMLRLYPAEPARSRAEFAHLVTMVRKSGGIRPEWHGSPRPGAVEPRDPLFPGTRYRVLREVAHGPMSVVLEAQHVDLGRKVALKVLDRERCRSPEAEARFRHEARIAGQIRHENLVQIHDFGISADGRPYYAMEFLEGESLAERLSERGRLPWREVVELGIQACQALEAAHALGVVHRDIKPANLFVTTSGVLKLLDFGITQADGEPDRTSTESLTLIGTPEYMAPEQIGRAAVDARADVYALGAVLYELVTGCLPHTGQSTVALLDNKVHDKVKAPSQRVRKLHLPRYLDRVLLTALATATRDRYDNVTGLRQDLSWILGSDERGRAKHRGWWVAGMATLGSATALAVVAGVALREKPQGTAVAVAQSVAVGHDVGSEPSVAIEHALPLAAVAIQHVAESSAASEHEAARARVTPTDGAQPAIETDVAQTELAQTPAAKTGTSASVAPQERAPRAAHDEAPSTKLPVAKAAVAKTDAPKTEAPKTEPSKTELAKTDMAKPRVAKTEAPKKDALKTDTAKEETAKAEAAEKVASKAAAETKPETAKQAKTTKEAKLATKAETTAKVETTAKAETIAKAETPSKGSIKAGAVHASRDDRADSAIPRGLTDPDGAADDDPEPESPARTTPANAAPTKPRPSRPTPRRDPELDNALAAAESLRGNHDIQALHAFRLLGEKHPNDPKVLEGWTRAAAATKWWGESLKVAEHWAEVDSSMPAQVNLARTQKRLGHIELAIETLKVALARVPNDREAASLLQAYGGAPIALR